MDFNFTEWNVKYYTNGDARPLVLPNWYDTSIQMNN